LADGAALAVEAGVVGAAVVAGEVGAEVGADVGAVPDVLSFLQPSTVTRTRRSVLLIMGRRR
jgi:hypothetical protein